MGAVALVEVIDEGPGIPHDILPRVFDRYAGKDGRGGRRIAAKAAVKYLMERAKPSLR